MASLQRLPCSGQMVCTKPLHFRQMNEGTGFPTHQNAPGFPTAQSLAPEKQSHWPFSTWRSSHSKAEKSSEQKTSLCFILLLFRFLLWKPSHFCGWLNHLMGLWGFPQDEDVHWSLFTQRTEKSSSNTQYLGPLHRKPHSLLPSHQGQPHSWSFTCLFIYLKGKYHLGF